MTNKPNSIEDLLATITPKIYSQLKFAVELGRWEDGKKLSKEQKEYCLQVVIAYDNTFTATEQRVGYIESVGKTFGRDKKGKKTG